MLINTSAPGETYGMFYSIFASLAFLLFPYTYCLYLYSNRIFQDYHSTNFSRGIQAFSKICCGVKIQLNMLVWISNYSKTFPTNPTCFPSISHGFPCSSGFPIKFCHSHLPYIICFCDANKKQQKSQRALIRTIISTIIILRTVLNKNINISRLSL